MTADDVKAARRERFEWMRAMGASDVSAELKVLGIMLALHANDRTGMCCPSVMTLAESVGKIAENAHPKTRENARRTVQRQLQALRARGWISYHSHAGGRNKTTPYQLTKPWLSCATVSAEPKPWLGSPETVAELSPETVAELSHTNKENKLNLRRDEPKRGAERAAAKRETDDWSQPERLAQNRKRPSRREAEAG